MTALADLRDDLAKHFAAALAPSGLAPDVLARRAYDLAEAMLAERARRLDDLEREAIQEEPPLTGRIRQVLFEPEAAPIFPPAEFQPEGLLDEPMPPLEEPEEEPEIPPLWDVEPKWRYEEPASERLFESERPGLARTRPAAAMDERREKTGTGSR